jgi:hypothetical protein
MARRGDVNLLVYAMSTNEPGTPHVSLDLGVMADLGKLLTSASDMLTGGDAVASWRVTMYLDAYPTHRLLTLSPGPTTLRVEYETVQDSYESAHDRLREFVRAYYLPGGENGLVIGGHGRAHRTASSYTGVGMLSDGTSDALLLERLVQDLAGITGSASVGGTSQPFAYLALDSCCLATLEILRLLEPLTRYVVAFQDEAPWNGFVSSELLQVLSSTRPLRSRLASTLDVYAREARSQDKPSSISLLSTEHAALLYDVLHHTLPSTRRKRSRDLLAYAREYLSDRTLGMVERLYPLVVLEHSVPANIPARRVGVRNGLSLFI